MQAANAQPLSVGASYGERHEDAKLFPATWLVLERSGVDVCMRDPGYEVDLVVHADVGAPARVWAGHLGFAGAVRAGGIKLEGAKALVQAFPRWWQLSHFAHVLQPARAG
jgi:hypothetical protein